MGHILKVSSCSREKEKATCHLFYYYYLWFIQLQMCAKWFAVSMGLNANLFFTDFTMESPLITTGSS